MTVIPHPELDGDLTYASLPMMEMLAPSIDVVDGVSDTDLNVLGVTVTDEPCK